MEWQNFRKKPVVIRAYHWDERLFDDIVRPYPKTSFEGGFGRCPKCKKPVGDHGICSTLEGWHIVCPNDWIIEGVEGEKYPCKPDIFNKTYEKA